MSNQLEIDINRSNELINAHKFHEAEKILAEYLINDEPTLSTFWHTFGHSLRGQGKLNEAYEAFKKATQTIPALGDHFHSLGRLEGEAMSFHRCYDIRMSKYGKTILAPPEKIVYSCFGEQRIISKLLEEGNAANIINFCVDLGASDGLTFSNTYPLYKKGWKGLCVEARSCAFSDLAFSYRDLPNKITLFNEFVTPHNVLDIFRLSKVPKDFGLLSLDIDSYDYFVLEKILEEYRPKIICTEINELIPPPVNFALKYTENISIDMQIGQSICMVDKLLTLKGYSIIWLEYNNVFAVQNSLLPHLTSFTKLSPEEAFEKGLVSRPDWKLKLPWNMEVKNVIYNVEDKLKTIKERLLLPQHQESYICY